MHCTKLLNIPDNHVIGYLNDDCHVVTNSYYTKGSRIILHLKKPGAGLAHLCIEDGEEHVCYPIQIQCMTNETPACASLPYGLIDLYDESCTCIARNVTIDNIICNDVTPNVHVVYWIA